MSTMSAYAKHFSDFDKIHYQKFLEAKADNKDVDTYRISRELKKDFKKKLERDGLKKTDFLIKAIIQYMHN